LNGSIKAVLFDLDDTLYDEASFVASGFQTVAAHLADRFEIDKRAVFSAMMRVLMMEGRGKVFDRVLEGYGLYDPHLVAELVSLYRSHLPQISLYPDVQPTFQALRQYGTSLGIITDGLHVVQKRKVAALGLRDLVDVIVYTDELGQEYWKPHPAAFRQAVAMLGVEPSAATYVGNDLLKDFAGANSIGMFTVHLCRNGIPEEGDCAANAHITSLIEIIRVITGRER
jgi:putative hydrolase of the HAD superfamily